jgi:hypothetical protein
LRYNNTFFQVQTGSQNVWDCGNTGVAFKNNILIGWSTTPALGMYNISGGVTIDRDYNYFSLPMNNSYGTRFIASPEAHSLNGGDPRFVAAYNNCVTNNCDFRLQATSPLIGKGADLSGVWANAKDLDGTPRPQGGTWEMGAYEYTAIGIADFGLWNADYGMRTERKGMVLPNPIRAAVWCNYLQTHQDMTVYDLTGQALTGTARSWEGLCLVRQGRSPFVQRVAVIR